jgi:uncharacterized protein (TIGR02246 family)
MKHIKTFQHINEAKFNKKKLMKAMKKDDGMIQLSNGQEYVVYAYDNGNDDNDAMWGDKSIFALDQDGGEHEIEYSDIVSYNEMKSNSLTEGTLIDLRLVNENVEDEIELALTNWLNTLADGNAVKMTDLYLENGVLLGTVAKEIKQGRLAIQEYFEMFLKKSPIGSVDSFILQNFGDVCISDGTYTFEIDGEGGNRESVAARYTYVWKKENKKWMIATHHSSVNP